MEPFAGTDEIGRLQRELTAARLEGLLVLAGSSTDPDLAPFTGPSHLGRSALLLPASGAARLAFLTDMERDEAAATGLLSTGPIALDLESLRPLEGQPGLFWARLIERFFQTAEQHPGRWAVAGHLAAGTAVEACSVLSGEGWRWSDGADLMRLWRKYKAPNRRELFERPARGLCAAMRAVARVLADSEAEAGELRLNGEALKVGVLRDLIARELAAHGLAQPEGNLLAIGAEAGVPHNQGDSRRAVPPHEPLVVDLFPSGAMFADCTRTFCVGDPSDAFRDAFGAVLDALTAAHASCRAGVQASSLQEATCDRFEALGYETTRSTPATTRGYVHGLGHGVGYELHEYPSFREPSDRRGMLEEGDLLTLEPGLYDSDEGYGVRLEDLCYLSERGVENLTPLPYEWDPTTWFQG